MKYMIEFELPDNDTVLREIKTADVAWGIWGYSGCTKAKPAQRWIPTSVRLPEDNEEVLFCDNEGERWLGWHYGFWKTERLDFDEDDVVAWMPLPAPYIQEGDDKHEG